ncbi:hypothetical protein NDA13_006379 [Ustilago tritici]|nr:hypothetical protein NDA13_006379 [Ustilago tritici]
MSSNTSTPAASTAATKSPPASAHVEDVDDLDDLDDVLEEFNQPSSSKPAASAAATESKPPAASSSETTTANQESASAGERAADDPALDDVLSEDFAKELAQGMQQLMKELGGQANVDAEGLMAGAPGSNGEFNEGELMKQFEAMMAGFGSAPSAPSASTCSNIASSTAAGPSSSTSREAATTAADNKPGNFNDAISATLAKLKESDATATATATATSSSSASSNPFAGLSGPEGKEMAKLVAALGGSGNLSGLEGAMDNPELTKMLEGMMDDLMSRDILYEPLKELRDKYPAYLAGEESKGISEEDRKRYELQSKYIDEIVRIFEQPGYDAKNKEQGGRIQELMNQMQDCGSPPKEIVGDMPTELDALPGFGGSGNAGEECTIM